jgi:4-nitrophenyl phosphatase
MNAVYEAQGLLIDMDGVLWRGQNFLPGVKDFFTLLRERGIPFLLVTNNSTVSPDSTVNKLADVDVFIEPQEVLTSTLATAAYLQSVLPKGANLLVIGEDNVWSTMQAAGFEVQDEHDSAQAVVVGFDREINWYKMTQAALAIQAGALFVGTNPDVSFPIEDGQAPGNGAFVLALEAATSVSPVIVGKPEPGLFEQALKRLSLKPEHALMLGDRLETDILGAQQAGIAGALLLTGVTAPDQLVDSQIKPDFIYQDLVAFNDAFRTGPG